MKTAEIKPLAIEAWFEDLSARPRSNNKPLSWATVTKLKSVMRPEEAFGLKCEDIDWLNGLIHIRRGWSKGKETAGKIR